MFEYKPDFEETCLRWEAFWNGEMIDRPCVRVVAPDDSVKQHPHPVQIHNPKNDLTACLEAYDRYAAATYFGGEAVPYFFFPNFGPDAFSSYVGAHLEGFSESDCTSWAAPFVSDWATEITDIDHPHGYWWEQALNYSEKGYAYGKGRFAVGSFDLHSNLDCLAAIRSPANLMFDIIDCPDKICEALALIRAAYPIIYEGLRASAGQEETGMSCWLPYYSRKRFGIVQCDMICMLSPEHARQFALPAIEEEAAYLDHSCFHLDGPDALVHLDDILSIKDIDSVQWVPGAGSAPLIEWIDLLKRIQAAGKSVYVAADVDSVKVFHGELRPDKVFYDVAASSRREADELLDWFKANV